MKKALPSNRVAALAQFFAGIAGLATAAVGVWPNGTTTEIAAAGSFFALVSGPLAHQIGNMFWEHTPAGQALGTGYKPSEPVALELSSDLLEPQHHPSPPPPYAMDFAPAPEETVFAGFDGEPDYEAAISNPYPDGEDDQAPEHHPRAGGPDAPEPPPERPVDVT